jgi:hypothetical protein
MGKHKLVVAFGEELINELEEGNPIEGDNGEPDSGCIVDYSFDTKAEKEAFLQGVAAMSGWLGYMVMDEDLQEKYKEFVDYSL